MTLVDAKVELQIDGEWIDATAVGDGVLEQDPIRIRTGRANWTARTDSGYASFTLADRDGRWSPDYPSGAYFGTFRRNIPARVGVAAGDPYLASTGTGDQATTPNVGGGGGGSPSAPSVVSVTESAETANATTHDITMPTVTLGQRLLLIAAAGHSSFAPTADFDDWTQVLARSLHTFHRWVIYDVYVGSAELVTAFSGQTLQFTTTSSVKSSAQVYRISGARAGGAGVGWSLSATVASGFGDDPDGPSCTAAWGATTNRFITAFTSGGTGANVTGNPSGWTAGADGNVSSGVVVGSAHLSSSSATADPGAFTIDDDENWEAATIVYQPVEVAGSAGSLDVTGDLEVRIEFQLHEDPYRIPADFSSDRRVMLAHRSGGANGWYWELFDIAGDLHTSFVWFDSSGVQHRYETFGIEPLPSRVRHARVALRFTLDADNGSSESVGRFYHSDGIDGTWTEVGDGDTGEGDTDIGVNDQPLYVGGYYTTISTHAMIQGKTFGFRLYDGIGGTVVANPDFTAQAVGTGSFDDSTGATWTVQSGGEITDIRWRFTGELASIPTRWDISGNHVWAPVEAAGLFRRLRQGPRRLESPIRRAILTSAPGLVGYWPLEESGPRLTKFGPAVGTKVFVATFDTPNSGSNTDFLASAPLPTLGEALLTTNVDTYPATGEWQVRWLQSIPANEASDQVYYFQAVTSDMVWQVQWRDDNGGDLRVVAFRDGASVYVGDWVAFGATGRAWRMHLSVQQNGSSVDVVLDAQDPITGIIGGWADTAAVTGSAGVVTRLRFNQDQLSESWAFGHVTVQSVIDDLASLTTELAAFDGEPAGERVIRLCAQEGIPVRIQGDPADTEEMGPQSVATLMELLEECAATDLGILFEPRESAAVGYRTYVDMTNQSAAVELDYSNGELAGSPFLDRDDVDIVNDVTVRNWSGTTARAVLDDGTPMSVSEPPVGAGRYDRTFDLNGQDTRLPILAARHLVLYTPDEPRVTKLRIGLHYDALTADPDLADTVRDAQLGDLVTVANNLTVALGSTTIRQLIQGMSETITGYEHFIDALTTPGSPWSTYPGPVLDLDAVGGTGEILLTWSEPFNDGAAITSYDIQRSTAGAETGFADLATIDPAGAYTDTSVTNDVQYWYRVRATNSAGDADWSNVATATSTAAGDVPDAINDLTATTASASQIDLAWSAPTSTETITSYDIQRSATSAVGPWVDVEIDLSPTTSYSDMGLTAGTEYWYRVRATSSEGDAAWSNVDSDTTTAGSTHPNVVSITESADSSFGTSHVVTMPTLTLGQTVLIIGAMGGAPTATPSGWTEVDLVTFSGTTGFAYILEGLTAGQVTALSGGSVTLTTSGSVKGSFQAWRIDSTGGGGEGVSWAVGTAATAFTLTPDPPSVTIPGGPDDALIIAYEAAGGTGATVTGNPASYTAGADGAAASNYTVGSAYRQVTGSSEDPGSFTIDDGTAGENTIANTIALTGGTGGAGSPGTPAPTIPSFSSVLTITAGQNVKTLVEAQPEGAHITLAAGTHTNCENVRLKSNQHIRLATGCVLEGSGKGYCFRPLNQSTTGVAIGGDPAGARPVIRNYGNGTTNQNYGAILGRHDDPLNTDPAVSSFTYADTTDWFIYHIDLEKNSSNGIQQGSNWTLYDVEAHGHTVTGWQGDRIVGGLVHSCLSYWNALSPASGVSANGANAKYTWVNADEGRTDVTPIDRTKAQLIISNCTFEALDRDGGPGDCNIGLWFDLDCKDVLVEYCSFDDFPNAGCFVEGCNDIERKFNTFRNCIGFGNAAGQNFINGALSSGESTNIYDHDNTLINCSWAIVLRQSNRTSDWYNSNNSSFVNYAWPPSSGGVRYWLDNDNRATAISPSARSNMWTSGYVCEDNTLINCGRVVINEGTDGGGMFCVGSVVNAQQTFAGNDYSGSPSIQYYNKNNTPISFAAWQALGYDT